eukprot:m.659847 g.659847  ORF g.659847 m.659847 type:complete len:202 (+) comp22727_c1_seq4:1186-1791(+)
MVETPQLLGVGLQYFRIVCADNDGDCPAASHTDHAADAQRSLSNVAVEKFQLRALCGRDDVLMTTCDDEVRLAGRHKLMIKSGRLRTSPHSGCMLSYLLSEVVERNYAVMEWIGDRLAEVESDILEQLPEMQQFATSDMSNGVAREVHMLKRKVLTLAALLNADIGELVCRFGFFQEPIHQWIPFVLIVQFTVPIIQQRCN